MTESSQQLFKYNEPPAGGFERLLARRRRRTMRRTGTAGLISVAALVIALPMLQQWQQPDPLSQFQGPLVRLLNETPADQITINGQEAYPSSTSSSGVRIYYYDSDGNSDTGNPEARS